MGKVVRLPTRMTVGREECVDGWSVLHLEGALRALVGPELRRRVESLLRRGDGFILLDLAGVPDCDAAGVGELVRVFAMAGRARGVLQVTHAASRVRRPLELAGLFELLNAEDSTSDRSMSRSA
jgi:anti-sigma B factor antagonist